MVSCRPVSSRNLDRTQPAQRIDDILDQHFRRRSTGRDADGVRAVEPFRLHFAAVGDQIAGMPASLPISRRRLELELFLAPTTRITSTSVESSRTAVWRFCVA